MKPIALTQRRRQLRAAPSVSLFPFLAVLICTMGALVPLLLAISRQARLQAVQAAANVAERDFDAQAARETVQWRIDQLKVSRQKTESQLGDARMRLGHVEDHARRLRDQLAGLEASWAEFDRIGSEKQRQRSDLETELGQLKAQTAQAERRVADAQQAAARRPGSYAVVLYEGPHQTHRVPIYIECREDAIVLQPEGVVLTADDFEGPMGPGNPLAAALRAAREHQLTRAPDSKDSGEPYPLLLVRPSGITAYYAAREAMKSWALEFGYELIGDDWQLAFQKPDPQMARVVRQAVDSARLRQQQLVAMAPRSYGSRQRPTYRAAPGSGGVVREDGPEEDGDPGFRPRSPSGRIGSRFGPAGQGGPGGVAGPGGLPGSGGVAGPGGMPRSGSTAESGSEDAGASGGRAAGLRAEPSGRSAAVQRSTAATGNGATGGTARGTAGTPRLPEGYVAGRPPSEHDQAPPGERPPSDERSDSGGEMVMPLRPGEWRPREEPMPEKSSNKRPQPDVKSLAEKRGRDWGVPDARSKSVPITRPIHVECHPDRLVILPEQGGGDGRTIALGPRIEPAVDDFVAAVWDHMKAWGMAGRGMYWRPVLHVHMAPGAEQRLAELSALLADSGLMVEAK